MQLAQRGGMARTSPAVDTSLREQLEKLAALEPQPAPVLSLYLNLTPDQHGRDNYETFVRKVLAEHQKAFADNSAERESYDRDVKRINEYLGEEVNRSANGLAIFACAGAGEFFEAIQLDAPLNEHWFFVGAVPHLYPLARVHDQYPRYASVVLDTNRARIFVFGLGAVRESEEVTGVKTRRSSMGGWSQARYQRRNENVHSAHVKEVIETLERIVTADDIAHIIVAGDDVVVPLFKEQLPKHLEEKLIDVLSLPRDAAQSQPICTTGAARAFRA
jgi:peptide subunit release factor 1 (eRF1)